MVLGGGLEPPCLAAYAPQTYVSAIPPPERGKRAVLYTITPSGGKRIRFLGKFLVPSPNLHWIFPAEDGKLNYHVIQQRRGIER